jgi:ribosomal protein L37E
MGYTTFYAKYNRCRRCAITYSKDKTRCLNCGAKLATKRRVYASNMSELKETRRAHTRIE